MKEQNENLNLNENLNVNEAKEITMKEQNENLNVSDAMSAEEIQECLYTIGENEEQALFLAKDFVNYLEKQGICEEKQLKEWAIGQLLWEKDWPGPRSIWQEITKGATAHEGKKCRWLTTWKKEKDSRPYRVFRIEWGSEFSLYQEFSLALVAGLGKVAGVLASRKKRSGNSTVPGSSSTTSESSSTTSESSSTTSESSSTTSSTSSKGDTGTEVEKLKKENSSLYKEVEDLRAAQTKAYDRAKEEFSALLEASAKREKSATEVAEKVKEQATGMDEAILKALTTLNEAKSSQTKEKLLAIIEAAKAALAEAPKLEIGEPEQAKEK